MDRLLKIGFEKVGDWRLVGGKACFELTGMAEVKNLLYAFVCDGEIKYIGKTTGTLKNRMYQYQNPGPTQSTNINNNQKITELLCNGGSVEIMVLADNEMFHYGDVHINIAAGIEDNLIAKFNPQWNRMGAKSTVAKPCKKPSLPQRVSEEKLATNNIAECPNNSKGRYIGLNKYLAGKTDDGMVSLSFDEIEKIIKCKLPESAYTYRAWWSNGGNSQSLAWLAAGWKVRKIEMGQKFEFCVK